MRDRRMKSGAGPEEERGGQTPPAGGRRPGGRPSAGRRPPGGPMPPGGMQEEMLAIAPDFKKWRAVFFKLDCACAGFTFFLGCLFFFYFDKMNLMEVTAARHFLLYVLLPAALNGSILAGAALINRKLPENDMRLNLVPVITLMLINIVVSLTHRVFIVTIAVFCIPICMTTVFSSKQLCKMATSVGMLGAVISVVKQYLTTAEAERVWIIPQGIIMFFILFVMGLVAQTALSMTEEQKMKLFNYAKIIKEAQHRAEAANIAKSAFLANMSHEIRTPINAILGMNEMILRENENEQIAEYAKSIHTAGNSLLYLVNDVLDISKIESGRLELVDITYETSSFIHDCYNMVTERAEKKGLELKIECNPDLPSTLKGDEVRLRQVVTNLLSNAAKYTEKGSITLSADSRREQDQFFLVITVRDTGIGIKEENLKSLFSQFTRFDLEKNRNIEGTGLGLAISRQLVDLMRGDIQVQSIYGVGSSFTVTVPQQVIDETPMGDYYTKYREVSRENAKYQQSFEAPEARLLVVDDVEVNLRVIVNLLKKTKIRVDTAQSGKKCLELTSLNEYDLIFMDHMMPEMDGVQTYSRMKESENCLNKNTPVIMLTANAITGVREQYLQEGFADYLTKPVLGDRLEKMILKYLPEDKIRPGSAPHPSARQTGTTGEGGSGPASENAGERNEGRGGQESIVVLQNLFQLYSGVDLSLGMSCYRQDMDAYVAAVQSFAENPRIGELEELYQKKDTAGYQEVLRGVKSAALNTGFSGLSEQASALEKAAGEGDSEFLDQNHGAFLGEYRNAVSAIRQAITPPQAAGN